jgi:hypothetical protein
LRATAAPYLLPIDICCRSISAADRYLLPIDICCGSTSAADRHLLRIDTRRSPGPRGYDRTIQMGPFGPLRPAEGPIPGG